MSGHTPGRLKQRTGHPMDIVGPDEHYAFARAMRVTTLDNAEANARRLVACWNACEGLTTEHLENIDMLGETLAGRFAAFHDSERELMDTRDNLLTAIGACLDAFPVPPIGAANEHLWQQAMAHPEAVPDYVRACVAVHTELLNECRATLKEQGHLSDGEQCTLIRLKRAVEKATGEKL